MIDFGAIFAIGWVAFTTLVYIGASYPRKVK